MSSEDNFIESGIDTIKILTIIFCCIKSAWINTVVMVMGI